MAHDPYHVGKRKPLSAKQRTQLFVEHGGRCCVCQMKIKPGESWIDEHIKPLWLAQEGEDHNAWSNRAPAHVSCARDKTAKEAKTRAKGRRVAEKHVSGRVAKGKPMPGSRASKWKRKMDGSVVRRDER